MHELVTLVAKYLIGASIIVAVVFFFTLSSPKKKRFAVQAAIGAVIALVLAKIGSKLYHNPRPFVVGHFTPYFSHGNDNGFPSDHTLLSSFLGFLVLCYNRKVGAVLLVFAAFIGLARMKAGVHHSVDILGAFAFAAVGAWLAFFATKRMKTSKEP